jgi:hypothetical protein
VRQEGDARGGAEVRFMERTRALPLAALMAVSAIAPVSSAGSVDVQVANAIIDHESIAVDTNETRPLLFAYTGQTQAVADVPVTLSSDVFPTAARLTRGSVLPDARPDTDLNWVAAGRATPIKLNAQDAMPLHVLTPARANPYADNWFQRQETARDLWHWGGMLAGSRISGTQSIQNSVVGVSSQPIRYPSPDTLQGGGVLQWEDRHMIREAITTDHDPSTGQTFEGRFAVNLAMPSLRVVGGDGVFAVDTQTPPLVLPLPVRPSGLVVFNEPSPPPGVLMTWTRQLDFDARTLTVQATVKAGSVWPESGLDVEDASVRTWEWRPWMLFPGWDYGSLINGGPDALKPARLLSDGSVEVRSLTPDGLPVLPPGMLDLNLPVGAVVETAWGARSILERPLVAPGARVVGISDKAPVRGEAAVVEVEREGVSGISVSNTEEIGDLFVSSVRVDGTDRLLDASTELDSWTSVRGTADYRVGIYETEGLFLSTLLTSDMAGGYPHAAYYLWDAHSIDGSIHDVSVFTTFDPAIGGDEGDSFFEPFHTNSPYPEEMGVAQGFLDLTTFNPVPAVEARGDGSSVRHLQVYPNQPNTSVSALETTAFLLRDHGSLEVRPREATLDREPIIDTDIMFVLANGYRGTIWDRGLVPYFSLFLLL